MSPVRGILHSRDLSTGHNPEFANDDLVMVGTNERLYASFRIFAEIVNF